MTRPGTSGLVHDALYYSSDAELTAIAVPFLRAGLAADERAVVVCDEPHAALLAAAMDDPRVTCLPWDRVYQGTAATIAWYRRMMERELAKGARQVRLVGEGAPGESPEEWAEWSRFEAIVNHALAPYPLWCLCMYDTRTVPAEVLATSELTHPNLHTGVGRTASTRYLEPAEFLRRWAGPGPDTLEQTAPLLDVRDVTDLHWLRRNLQAALTETLPERTAEDFVFAANEVVTNATLYGSRPVAVQVWAGDGRAACAVTDQGKGFDDPLVGYVPAHGEDLSNGGMGLWAVRQLCARVGFTRTAAGFTVRLSTG